MLLCWSKRRRSIYQIYFRRVLRDTTNTTNNNNKKHTTNKTTTLQFIASRYSLSGSRIQNLHWEQNRFFYKSRTAASFRHQLSTEETLKEVNTYRVALKNVSKGYSLAPPKVVMNEPIIYESLVKDFKELVDEEVMQDRKERESMESSYQSSNEHGTG